MKRIFTIIFVIFIGYFSAHALSSYAGVTIPGNSIISDPSIHIPIASSNSITSAKDFGFRILGIIKTVISGFALIYLIMIGVYMILGSDNEETVKTQRKQMVYAMIGFIFLNIPGFIYTVFFHESGGSLETASDPTLTYGGSLLWNTHQFEGIMGDIVAFLRVFAFGAAVTMFTWGLFNLIVSGGDDEKKKKAKNRIVYGIIGLIFMGFVEMWGSLIAMGNFSKVIPVGNTLFSLVMYFSAPIAIFMIIWGAYYFITSAGDEERMKKGKSIVINTGIAIIILLSALSFVTDLSKFQL